jgi:hypothetical protein
MFPPAVLAFVSKPIVKYLGGALVIGLAVWFAVHSWNNYKAGLIEQGRKAGFSQAEAQFNAKIAENDRVNREVERGLIQGLTGFAKAFNDQRDTRVTVENRIARDIQAQIAAKPEVFNNPACVVPSDVIEGRNQIRAEGPRAEDN